MTTPVNPAVGSTPATATTAAEKIAAESAARAAKAAGKPDDMGKDTFLKLLVAQLKYQDPTKPADATAFLSQTAQFTMVEKLEDMARQNAELLTSQRALASSALIGRTVTTTGEDGATQKGVVTGVRLDATGPVLKVGTTAPFEVPLGAVTHVDSSPAG